MESLLLLLSLLQTNSALSTFCAVTLDVKDSDGASLEARYKVTDVLGATVASGGTRAGKASICDLDFGFYSISVITPGYYEVVIPNVGLMYGRTAHLTATMSSYPEYGLSDFRCWCYYRIKDTEGRPLGGVKVLFREQQLVSDMFGRVQVISPDHKDVVVRFEKEGYHPTEERFDCTKAIQKLTRAYVVLQRLK